MTKAYLDHAAATPVPRPVIEAMLPYFDVKFGNPAAVYDLGSEVKQTLEEQREKIANLLGVRSGHIIFTSSGAEANNMAIKGVVLAGQKKGNHIIVSAIEHHSVLNTARFFERSDYEVTLLPVDKYGLVDPQSLKKAIRPETILVSIMQGNNEIGTVQPISKLAAVCREKKVLFHTDAVATVGNIPVDVEDLGVDLLSLSGPSLGAPKGVGALYLRDRVRLMPLIHGGIQESGRRGGTENIPGIVGLGKAAELAREGLSGRVKNIQGLRDVLVAGLGSMTQVFSTGHPEKRLPGHASFCVAGIEGEALIFMLNGRGIYANTGSACASKALKVSPVLVAIGVPPELAQGSVVFTLGRNTTKGEIEYVMKEFPEAVKKLRRLSPVWKDEKAA